MDVMLEQDAVIFSAPTYDLMPSSLFLKFMHRNLAYESAFLTKIGAIAPRDRVGALIAVGGSTRSWQSMALECMQATTFTNSFKIVDMYMATQVPAPARCFSTRRRWPGPGDGPERDEGPQHRPPPSASGWATRTTAGAPTATPTPCAWASRSGRGCSTPSSAWCAARAAPWSRPRTGAGNSSSPRMGWSVTAPPRRAAGFTATRSPRPRRLLHGSGQAPAGGRAPAQVPEHPVPRHLRKESDCHEIRASVFPHAGG